MSERSVRLEKESRCDSCSFWKGQWNNWWWLYGSQEGAHEVGQDLWHMDWYTRMRVLLWGCSWSFLSRACNHGHTHTKHSWCLCTCLLSQVTSWTIVRLLHLMNVAWVTQLRCLSFKPWNHSTFVEMLQNAHPIPSPQATMPLQTPTQSQWCIKKECLQWGSGCGNTCNTNDHCAFIMP